jgi:hypothetical protein
MPARGQISLGRAANRPARERNRRTTQLASDPRKQAREREHRSLLVAGETGAGWGELAGGRAHQRSPRCAAASVNRKLRHANLRKR